MAKTNRWQPSSTRKLIQKIKMVISMSAVSHGTGRGHSKSHRSSFGFNLVKGRSHHPMEDYHVCEYRKVDGHELGLFAIFDGHLGHHVAEYLQTYLFDNILNEPLFWKDPWAAISEVYKTTDNKILENVPTLGLGGSTAATMIMIDGKHGWVANLGDSRVVLSQQGIATQLSVDHEPVIERKSIEEKGGFVSQIPGDVPRVDGQLAVARAFGDKSLKRHMRTDPDIKYFKIDASSDLVILASDGLWKVMENQEAVDLVKGMKDPQAASKKLTEEALARKSKDDISCIVVRLR